MGKFFAGILVGILTTLSWQHFSSSSEGTIPEKDTITIQMGDQTIEIPDTTKKDSVK